MFTKKTVFDRDYLQLGMAVRIKPLWAAEGEEYPLGLRRGNNYGLIVQVEDEEIELLVFDYEEKGNMWRNLVKPYTVHIQDLEGNMPHYEIELLQ